jgi:hypothetical protein
MKSKTATRDNKYILGKVKSYLRLNQGVHMGTTEFLMVRSNRGGRLKCLKRARQTDKPLEQTE